MGRYAKRHGRRTTVLPLGPAEIEIEWQASPPSEDVLARLLLALIGEDVLKEIFDD